MKRTIVSLTSDLETLRDKIVGIAQVLTAALTELPSPSVLPDVFDAKSYAMGLVAGLDSLLDLSRSELSRFAEAECGELAQLGSLIAQLLHEVRDPKTKLDGKFYGAIYREKDNSLVDPQDYVVFLASDRCFLSALKFYRNACEEFGAEMSQVEAVQKLIERVRVRQIAIADQMKLPDVDPGELSWDQPGTTP